MNIRLTVISDGSREGTYVIDQHGNKLDNVIKVEYRVDMEGNPQVFLTLVGVPVFINYDPVIVDSVEDIKM